MTCQRHCMLPAPAPKAGLCYPQSANFQIGIPNWFYLALEFVHIMQKMHQFDTFSAIYIIFRNEVYDLNSFVTVRYVYRSNYTICIPTLQRQIVSGKYVNTVKYTFFYYKPHKPIKAGCYEVTSWYWATTTRSFLELAIFAIEFNSWQKQQLPPPRHPA